MTEDSLNLIRKIVWYNIKSHPGFEFDDLFSEACIIYLETITLHNPAIAKEGTFIYHTVNNGLKNIIKREKIRKIKELQTCMYLDREYAPSPEQQLIAQESWQEFLAGLSPEAKEICSVILEEDVYLPTDKPKACRGIIKEELRKKDWGWNHIWSSFRELKNATSAPTA